MEIQTSKSSERSLMEGMLHYLGILLRYKWLIAILTALGTGAVVAFCIISIVLPPSESPLPDEYTAQATILVQNGQSDIGSTLLEALGLASGRAVKSFDNGDQIMEILRSRSQLDKLIDEFSLSSRYGISDGLKGKSRQAVLAHYSILYQRNSGVMRISYTDIDPVFSQTVVNRMVDLLGEWFSLNRNQAKQKQQLMLEEKIAAVKKDIASLKYRLKAIPDVDPQFSQLTAELDVQQRIYNTLSPQYEAAKLTPESAPTFQVFEMAEVPDMKSGPKRTQYMAMAFAGSFIGSCILAFFLNIIKTHRRKKITEQ